MCWLEDKMTKILTGLGIIPKRLPVEERDPDYQQVQRRLREIRARVAMLEMQRQVIARENPDE